MRIERSEAHTTAPSGQKPSKTECLLLLNEYLDANPFITRSKYGELARCNKQNALQDLSLFIEQGVVRKHGMGKQIVYVRNTTPKT